MIYIKVRHFEPWVTELWDAKMEEHHTTTGRVWNPTDKEVMHFYSQAFKRQVFSGAFENRDYVVEFEDDEEPAAILIKLQGFPKEWEPVEEEEDDGGPYGW